MRGRVYLLPICTLIIIAAIRCHAEDIGPDTDPNCHPIVRLSSETVITGRTVILTISLEEPIHIGRFDLLLSYEPGGLSFVKAQPSGILEDWEYVTYRYGQKDTCDVGCPASYARIIGVADIPNLLTPEPEIYLVGGGFIQLTFWASPDRQFLCDSFDINWLWTDCGDNVLGAVGGDTLFVAHDIQHLLPEGDCLNRPGPPRPVPVTDFIDGQIRIGYWWEGEGDCDVDGKIDGLDIIFWINYVFHGGPAPEVPGFHICEGACRADFNCDDRLNLVDLAALIRYVYRHDIPRPCDPCGFVD